MAFRILLCVFLSLVTSFGAQATQLNVFTGGTFAPANMMNMHPSSGVENLLISFYRNTTVTPDFKRWSFQTPKTLNAADYDRSVVALNEQVRLQTTFQNTDPAGFLTIQAPLDVSRYSSTQEILFLQGVAASGTLLQNVYGEKLAISIPELRKFQALKMSNEQAGNFYRVLTEDGRMSTITVPVVAEMILKPRQALFRKQNRVGKDDHYMFQLDLAQFTIWAKPENEENQKPLWTWKADWYKPNDDNAELLQLYKAIN